MMNVIRTQISLHAEQMEALRKLAVERGISIAALVREAVDRLLGAAPSPSDRRAAALGIVGAFASGDSDVSERHDDYLTGAFGE